MIFAHPHALWLLLALPPLVVWQAMALAQGRRQLRALVAARLEADLVRRLPSGWAWALFLLQILGLGALIVAGARPQWGNERLERFSSGRQVLLAMDTSKSMLAQDVIPDRITQARMASLDLLEKLGDDRIGVIAFAGTAFLQAPLTPDHDALREAIDQLDWETIPRGGSNLAAPIEMALETFKKSSPGPRALILFTDGGALEGETIRAAEQARREDMPIFVFGVGTLMGAPLPDPEGNGREFIRDETGKMVRAPLEEAVLREIAQKSGGAYARLDARALPLAELNRVLGDRAASGSATVITSRPKEQYQWPLAAGLFFLLLGAGLRKFAALSLLARDAAPRVAPA